MDRSGYIAPEDSCFRDPDDSEITIGPMSSYTYCMSYPALTEDGVFWVRVEGIYSERLRITYHK